MAVFLRGGGKGEVGSEFLKNIFLNYELSNMAEGHTPWASERTVVTHSGIF